MTRSSVVPSEVARPQDSFASDAIRRGAFACLLVLAAGLRIWAATLGSNYDLESWHVAANLVQAGKNVYVHTLRLPYGPVWAYIAWLVLRIQGMFGWSGMASFHVLLAIVLTSIDVGIAVLLARMRGYVPALMFAFCPVSIIITGYHSQIDNIAIFLALVSWYMLEHRREPATVSDVVIAGLVLGISLATKHVFVLFPVWLLLSSSRSLRHRITYAGVAYAVFLVAFVPFVLTPEGMNGVYEHVFAYRGVYWYGNALLPRMIPDASLWGWAFVGGMLVSGIVIARCAPRQLIYLYPVALVIFTTTLAHQHLTIPAISFAVYWKNPAMWAYVAVSMLAICASTDEIGALEQMQFAARPLRNHGYHLFPGPESSLLPQICLVAFLLTLPVVATFRRWREVHATMGLRPIPGEAPQSTVAGSRRRLRLDPRITKRAREDPPP